VRIRRKWALRIFLILFFVGMSLWRLQGPTIEDGSYLTIEVAGNYKEGRPGGAISRMLNRDKALVELTDNLRKARYDGRIRGVVIRIGALGAGWAQTKEIRDALGLLRAEGKKVVAIVELELAKANKEFYLASVADQIYVPAAASPLLNGLSANFLFLGGLWPKIDVNVHVEQIREYKSAGDTLSRETMSEPHREMANSILDSVNGHFLQTLANARDLPFDELRQLIDSCPDSASDLLEAGIIDKIGNYEDLLSDLKEGDKDAPMVAGSAYLDVGLSSLGLETGPKIAVIHATGTIVSGLSGPSPGNVGSREIGLALKQATEDDEVKAIVLRISSPGGSPGASDEIWQQMRKASEKKPIVASLGDVAASGGYYIAAGADRIVAHATTLTGSIGVVFFKPDFSALSTRIGVNLETLSRGRYARLLDLNKDFDEGELEIVRNRLDSIYELFLDRIATTRDLDSLEIDRLGGGRVWTGEQAKEIGLIDEIGGFAEAVREAAAAAGIHDPEKADLVYFPKQSFAERHLATLRSRAAAESQQMVASQIGLGSWQGAQLAEWAPYLDLGPGAYTLMPEPIVIE
jgi:protease-4